MKGRILYVKKKLLQIANQTTFSSSCIITSKKKKKKKTHHSPPRPLFLIYLKPLTHLPAHIPLPTLPTAKPASPTPPASSFPLTLPLPLSLTPRTISATRVSTTTPPTTISARQACMASKLKIKSSSHTLLKRRSRASTKTWIRSSSARGDSVEVEMRMKYKVA